MRKSAELGCNIWLCREYVVNDVGLRRIQNEDYDVFLLRKFGKLEIREPISGSGVSEFERVLLFKLDDLKPYLRGVSNIISGWTEDERASLTSSPGLFVVSSTSEPLESSELFSVSPIK